MMADYIDTHPYYSDVDIVKLINLPALRNDVTTELFREITRQVCKCARARTRASAYIYHRSCQKCR